MMFTVAEILKVTGGKLLQGQSGLRVSGVATDTRKIRVGELFVAIKGDNFDGNAFTIQAAAAGAAALVVSRADVERPAGVAVILVRETVKALGHMARHHRLKFKVPVIAVTGSAGKTTTKEFIAGVLGVKYRVLYNKGTENNHIGVPMTLLQLEKKHQAAVIEAGTNHPGEIDWLGSVICPTVAVFTNVGPSHLAGLESLEGVFKEKVSLIGHLAKNGTVIVNADDPCLCKILKRKLTQKIITYGIEQDAEVKALCVRPCDPGLEVELGKGRGFLLPTPVWGNVFNALAAVACGRLFKVPFKDIAAALQGVVPAKGRQCFHAVRWGTLIDDTYNANPLSYHNAIRTLSAVRGSGRAFLVAADMLELGSSSEALHIEVGEAAARAGIDHILTIGRWAETIGHRARQISSMVGVKHYQQQEDILADLVSMVREGDAVLVKGSRGMCMDRLVEQLLTTA